MERMMRIELTPSAWKAEVLPLNYIRKLERKTRFELATLALARRCSTPEPLPHKIIKLVEGDGFEPSKAQLTDLQSAPLATRESLDIGAGGGNRTPNLLITNQLLYR